MSNATITVVVYKQQDAPCVQCNGVINKLHKDKIEHELVEYEPGSEIQRVLTEDLGLRAAPGVVVYNEGKVVTSHTFGGFRPDRITAIGNLIKEAASSGVE